MCVCVLADTEKVSLSLPFTHSLFVSQNNDTKMKSSQQEKKNFFFLLLHHFPAREEKRRRLRLDEKGSWRERERVSE